jgi:DNA-binding MarR family transcriptional regulator
MSKRQLEVADKLHSTSIHLLRAIRHVDDQSGLSAARLSALSVVVFAGPATVGRLAAAERVKSPTMSGIVNGLVGEGLVERRPVAADQRASEVTATDKGRALLAQARGRRIEALSALLEGVSDEELTLLDRAAGVLSRMFGGPG